MWRNLFIGAWCLTFAVVATAETRTDVNRSKNFSQYKTFAVQVSPPVDSSGSADVANTIAMDRLRHAVTRELQARGLEPTDVRPHLIVRVSSGETEETVLAGTGWGYPYGYGGYTYSTFSNAAYWGGWGGAWTYTYIEGTVRVDVIEASTGDLVYRGEYVDDVDKDLDKEANKAVRKAMKKFPVGMRYSD
jgi:hypothetical protein